MTIVRVFMGGMKDRKALSAGLVSKPFWFYEYKTYTEQINKGYTAEEIKAQALQMNLFPAAKEYRVKNSFLRVTPSNAI